MKQIILTIGLAVSMLLSSLPSYAYDFEVDGIYYSVISPTDLTCEVVAGDNKYAGDVNIPSSVTYKSKQLDVISIGASAFEGCTGLTSVTIGNSVTSIGSVAFRGCIRLTGVTIGNSVTYIGIYAFQDCTGLTSVDIPDSVTSIGEYAFYGCIGLTGVTIGNSVTEIGRRAFMDCTGLTSIDIPDSVTKIGDSAFSGCTRLTSVDIPDSVTEINYCAFSGCTGLTSVDIPDSVTEIGSSAFEGCTGLTGVDIPDSVTSIGSSAFEGCTGLTGVTIGNSVTEIGRRAFMDCTGLTSVDIPDSVTSIGGSAFADCTSLTEVKISANVTELYAYWTSSKDNAIFYGCSNIVNLTFNDSVEKLTLDNRKEYHSSVSSFPSPFYSLQLKELYLGREINLKIYDSYYIYKYPETLEKITFGPKLSDIGDFYRRISTIPTSAVIYCLNPTLRLSAMISLTHNISTTRSTSPRSHWRLTNRRTAGRISGI